MAARGWRDWVEDSAPPEPIKRFIHDVVKRTRLRSDEKTIVAWHLLAHFGDALEAGASAEEAIAPHGDPKKAAAVLRKNAILKRWWVERAAIRAAKVILGLVIVFSVAWVVAVIFAAQRVPTITTDYLAMLNAKALATPEAERAWPKYRQIALDMREQAESWEGGSTIPAFDHTIEGQAIWPGDDGWEAILQRHHLHRGLLPAIREAASMPALGSIVATTYHEDDLALWGSFYQPPNPPPGLEGSLFSILLPHLSVFLDLQQLVGIDAQWAAARGDSDRVLADVETLIGIARHLGDSSIFVSQAVARTCLEFAADIAARILWAYPDCLDGDDLERLAAAFAQTDDILTADWSGERALWGDMLQRFFTDDGHGDGYLIPTLLPTLVDLNPHARQTGFTMPVGWIADAAWSAVLASPALDVCVATRKEHSDAIDRFMVEVESTPLPATFIEWLRPHSLQQDTNLLLPFPSASFHAGQRAALTTRIHRDALMAAIHILQQHEDTGQWPTSLAGTGLQDPWADAPLTIAIVQGEPVIYSVGVDQDDDGGTPPWVDEKAPVSKPYTGQQQPPNGDWILWPNDDRRSPNPLSEPNTPPR
jgi:hypothetical protein